MAPTIFPLIITWDFAGKFLSHSGDLPVGFAWVHFTRIITLAYNLPQPAANLTSVYSSRFYSCRTSLSLSLSLSLFVLCIHLTNLDDKPWCYQVTRRCSIVNTLKTSLPSTLQLVSKFHHQKIQSPILHRTNLKKKDFYLLFL